MNTLDIMNKCILQKDSDQFHRSESQYLHILYKLL